MQSPPRDVALFILRALFGEAAGVGAGEAGVPGRTHPLTAFQEAAVRRLRGIIHRRGGAVLADAVGLGKTYVALALMEERLRAGDDVVVAIPAALRGLWRAPLRRLARALDVGGAPGVGGAAGDGAWRLVSHAQLSRGVSIRPAPGPGRRLVVVDEAHRFRNPATRRYGALARLLEPGAAALFITATPINNSLDDLYHLVRLFLPDYGLRDAGVPSLRGVFEGPPGGAVDAVGVRTVVRELVVRRSRPVVETRFGVARVPGGPPVGFPARASPRIHRWASPGVRGRVAAIDALELAAYGPGVAPLLRLGLLKRLDSSPVALATSVARAREFLAAFRDAAAAGRLLRPGDRRVGGDDDPFQLLLLGVVAEAAPPELDLAALMAATDRDLDRLDRLLPATPDPDGKARALVSLLESIPDKPVLVFTEYRDTAEAVWRALLPRFRVGRIDGAGAWLGASPAGRRRVVERFAPEANGRRPPPDRERVDVLVATDVLAEGLNLQDARQVVSYDLPWNPVRLLQRIGRVDRLGSPHDVVVPHLFVPADGLDAVLGLTRRLRTKLHGIASALGEEQADALLEGLAAGRPDLVETALRTASADRPDPTEELRTLWVNERNRFPTPGAETTSPRLQVARVRSPEAESGVEAIVLAAAPGGGRGRLFEVYRDGEVAEPTDAAVRIITAGLRAGPAADGTDPPGADPTPGTDLSSCTRALIERVDRHLRERRVVDRAPPPLGRRRAATRLARRIRAALADAGAGAAPETVRRAEAVLTALAVPPRPAREQALAALLDVPGARDGDENGTDPLTDLLDRAEAALGAPGPNRSPDVEPSPTDPPAAGGVRAVLLVSEPLGPEPAQPG